MNAVSGVYRRFTGQAGRRSDPWRRVGEDVTAPSWRMSRRRALSQSQEVWRVMGFWAVGRRVAVGAQLGFGWGLVGTRLGRGRVRGEVWLGFGWVWSRLGSVWMGHGWVAVGSGMRFGWGLVGFGWVWLGLVGVWLGLVGGLVGVWLGFGWDLVELKLVDGWEMVRSRLGHGWATGGSRPAVDRYWPDQRHEVVSKRCDGNRRGTELRYRLAGRHSTSEARARLVPAPPPPPGRRAAHRHHRPPAATAHRRRARPSSATATATAIATTNVNPRPTGGGLFRAPPLVFLRYLLNRCRYHRQTCSTLSPNIFTHCVKILKSRVS